MIGVNRNYYREITISPTPGMTEDLTNFPFFIRLDGDDFANCADAYCQCVMFVDETFSYILPAQWEEHLKSSHVGGWWVRLPTYYHDKDTKVYCCYGAALTYSDLADGPLAHPMCSTNVWDTNFICVQNILDAAGYLWFPDCCQRTFGASSSTAWSNTSGTLEVTGLVNRAITFNGSARLTGPVSGITGNNAVTIEAFVKTDDGNGAAISFGTLAGVGTGVFVGTSGGNYAGGGAWQSLTSSTAVNSANYRHVCFTYVGGTNGAEVLSVDGTSAATGNHTGNFAAAAIQLGDWASSFALTGTVDSARISNIARSQSWVNATAQHVLNQATYVSVGDEQTLNSAPAISVVKTGTVYYLNGTSYTGTKVHAGEASGPLTLAKETGANARGGSGTCAKLTPSSTTAYGYWHFRIKVISALTRKLTFYHKISSGFNGSVKCTVYDTDQETELNSSETVTLTDDGAYHLFESTGFTPSSTGFCLVRLEVEQGAHSETDAVYIDDVELTL